MKTMKFPIRLYCAGAVRLLSRILFPESCDAFVWHIRAGDYGQILRFICASNEGKRNLIAICEIQFNS